MYFDLVKNWEKGQLIPLKLVAAGIKTQEEIKRILACAVDKYDDILGLDHNIQDNERKSAQEHNWKKKGCQLHPNYCRFKQADEAYASKRIMSLTLCYIINIFDRTPTGC